MKKALAVCLALFLLAGCSGTGRSSSQESSASAGSQGEILSREEPREELPSMDERQQEYAEKYLSPLAYSGFFWREYTGDPAQLGKKLDEEGNVAGSDLLFMLFEDSFSQEEREELYAQYPDGIYPQEVVEEPLISHFGWTAEQIRSQLSESYDPQAGTYRYLGGRGGGPIYYIVTGSSAQGDILTLDYEVYGLGGSEELEDYLLDLQAQLTIQVDGEDFTYQANHIQWARPTPTARDN
ncbi:hypothetical protein [Merdimmobilis hominis]|uniref:hypothetical protein n=1 Tax=Merdimmobilis hominis TaxID=2897707 RepID=UPI0006C77E6F|nr:hypothetical protein [Merdimmobilis hominis]